MTRRRLLSTALGVIACMPAMPATTTPAASTAAAPATGTVIVANMGDNTAALIDVASRRVVGTLPTGAGAHEVAVSNDGRYAVVSNYGVRGAPGNSLTVIDVPSTKVVRTIDLGEFRRPHRSVFLPGDTVLAVTSEMSRAEFPGSPSPEGVVVSRDGRMAFVTLQGSSRLAMIDLAGVTVVAYVPTGAGPDGVGFSPFGR